MTKDELTAVLAVEPYALVSYHYPGGACRIFVFTGEVSQMLIDTHYDREFAEYIEGCVRRYLSNEL
jgi:hypothetical protein